MIKRGVLLRALLFFVGGLDPLLFERLFFVWRVANLVVGFCFAISQRGTNVAFTMVLSVWDHRATVSLVIVLCLLTYLPNALYNYALHHVEPFRTSIFSYIQPVAAIVLSSILRLDTLRLPTLCFAMLIFVGIGIVLSSYHPHHNGHSAQP